MRIPQPSDQHATVMATTREERIARLADAAARIVGLHGGESTVSLRADDALFLVEHYRFVPSPHQHHAPTPDA